MPPTAPTGYAYNRTRHAYLATQLSFADTHLSRLRGLMGMAAADFQPGHGLWIVPSRGVHTFGMRFPLDIVYLDREKIVLYLQENLKPWRLAPVRMRAVSVLELPGNTLGSSGTAVGDRIEIAAGQPPKADRE